MNSSKACVATALVLLTFGASVNERAVIMEDVIKAIGGK